MICEKMIKKYCCEDISKIENYEDAVNDTTQSWHCHHRLETHNSDGERRLVDLTHKELKALEMYYNRPANELVFLMHIDHRSLHKRGKNLLKDSKQKISNAHKGRILSDEWKRKISENHIGMKGKHHSEEAKKKLSETMKGKKRGHWKLVDGKRVYY